MYNSIEILLDRLMSYYKVSTISDLATQMKISQQTISAWKSRGSINAIKKRCRELGIFDEIFQDLNFQNVQSVSGGQVANVVNGNQKSESESMHKDIDAVTLGIINEAYKNAEQQDRIKEFRIHIMNFE